MSSDDPFSNGDSDRTILRPMPGGRRPATPDPAPSTPPVQNPVNPDPFPDPAFNRPAPSAPRSDMVESDLAGFPAVDYIVRSGVNPLVACADELLVLGAQLRNTVSQDRVAKLKEQIVQQLKRFEDQAYSKGIDRDTVLTARYLLCTYLDGAVASTPWGIESGWTNQSLLSVFHNETWGGEKFFQILDKHLQSPSQSIDLLEFIFTCLALGFQGKYSLSNGGAEQLIAIQESLFRTINLQRGDFERDLSPHWQGVKDQRNALARYVPLWVIAAVLGVALLAIYSGFRFVVAQSNSSIFENLDLIRNEQSIDSSQ